MAVRYEDAVRTARSLLGTPYSGMDCIRLIVMIIRKSPGGDPAYRCEGTNWLWKSAGNAKKYRHLTWRQTGVGNARAGMLAFRRSGSDVHHVGLVTGEGTVIHASSVKGMVIETPLDGTWDLLARHRELETALSVSFADSSPKGEDDDGQSSGSPLCRCGGTSPKGGGKETAKQQSTAPISGQAPAGREKTASPYGRGVAGGDGEGNDGGAQEENRRTTLVRSDGVSIVLEGRWRLAQD